MLQALEDALKKERESSELSYLDSTFFFRLQEDISRLKSLKDPLSEKKLELLQEGVEELVTVRAEKMLKGHRTNMLPAESTLAECAATFKKFKKDVIKVLLQKDSTALKVKILKDLPQFYGPELEILGPFKKGDIVLLNRTVVTLLKEKELVEQVV